MWYREALFSSLDISYILNLGHWRFTRLSSIRNILAMITLSICSFLAFMSRANTVKVIPPPTQKINEAITSHPQNNSPQPTPASSHTRDGVSPSGYRESLPRRLPPSSRSRLRPPWRDEQLSFPLGQGIKPVLSDKHPGCFFTTSPSAFAFTMRFKRWYRERKILPVTHFCVLWSFS